MSKYIVTIIHQDEQDHPFLYGLDVFGTRAEAIRFAMSRTHDDYELEVLLGAVFGDALQDELIEIISMAILRGDKTVSSYTSARVSALIDQDDERFVRLLKVLYECRIAITEVEL